MGDLPWFQFYPNDWLSGTRGLSAVETGIYITIIATLYDRAAPLPNDPERLARMCGAGKRQFVAALQRLVDDGKLIIVNGGIWNTRVEEELQNRDDKVQRSKKAAETRWTEKSEQKQSESDAGALPTQCQNDAISEVRSQKSDISNNLDAGGCELEQLEIALREAAGWQRDPSPNLFVTGPIHQLIVSGGCSLDLDVLPTVRAKAPRVKGRKNWNYFIEAIQQARDDRLSAARTPDLNNARGPNATAQNRNSIANSFALIDAAIAEREAELDRLEAGSGIGGEGLKLVS